MDQEMLKVLAQFRILLKKEKGVMVDFERLMAEPAYARGLLAQAEDSDNELLVTLALSLHEKLGLLAAPAAPAPNAAARPATQVDPQKYKFGARS
jgi:hypothetical protein